MAVPSTPKSLHSLSVTNPRFAVNPLFWTSRHLALVKCSFQQIEDAHTDVEPRENHQDYLTEYAQELAMNPVAGLKFFWICDILHRDGSSVVYDTDSAGFFYAKRRVHRVQCRIFSTSENDEAQVNPIIGFYEYNVDQERCNKLRTKRANGPVKRLIARKIQRVTPEDWRKDPYIICLLLAMAQQQWRKGLKVDVYQVRLMVTHMTDQKHACVYKADIPQQLLKGLEYPRRSMGNFPTVNYTKVPFEPYKTFSERIELHLLGATPSFETKSEKRKRKCDETDQPPRKVQKLE
ncbi:hypothetical protein ACHAQK_011944 [Fusarium lateritium]